MQQVHLPMYIRTCSWNVSYPFQLQYVPVYHHHSDVLFLHSTIREIFRFNMHDLLLSYYWLRHGNHLFRNIFPYLFSFSFCCNLLMYIFIIKQQHIPLVSASDRPSEFCGMCTAVASAFFRRRTNHILRGFTVNTSFHIFLERFLYQSVFS